MIYKQILLYLDIILILNYFCKYFIQGYYSPYRYFKASKEFFISIKYYFYYALLVITFILSFFTRHYFYILYVINIYYFFIIPKPLIKYRRRGLTLFLFTSLILFPLIFIEFFSCFLLIIGFFLIPLTNFILIPFEKNIQIKYIKQAKNKILKYNPKVIGITGSFGKTTFKEYLYALLKNKYKVLKSTGNYNTLMGLCKFINNELNENYDFLILEMGIDQNHGILKYRQLCSLDIAVITGIGKVHLSTFKNYNNIINSKCEIESLMKDKGMLFFNGEYLELQNHQFQKKNTPYYDEKEYQINNLNKFQNMALNGIKKIGEYLNIEEKYFTYFLNNLPIIKRRFEIKKYQDIILINDSYNINPNSFNEDIKYMSNLSGTKIIITGGLIELGKDFYHENYHLGLKMKEIDYLFLITKNKGHPLAKAYAKYNKHLYIIKNLNSCKKIIKNIKGKKIILLSAKGSDYFLR